MQWLSYLQWPAMVVTIAAAWLVASSSEARRKAGFYLYFASNLLWTAWALHVDAYALIALQVALFVMNVRGVSLNEGDGR